MADAGQGMAGRERRADARLPFHQEASLLVVRQNSFIPCQILDMSLGGCRIRTERRFLAGPMIRVEVCFRFQGAMLRLPGVTQWTDRKQAAGIRFLDMSPRRVEALAEVLAGIQDGPPPEADPTPSTAVVEFPKPVISASRPSLDGVVQMQRDDVH